MFRRLNTISPSGTLGSRFAGTSQLISQVACPQSIAVASQIARRCTSRRVSARILCIVISLPKAVSRPREAASNRQTASHAGEVDFPSPGTFRTGYQCPSPLSSSLEFPGTTPEANSFPTALQGCCGSPRPTCGTLPQCGLSTTRTTFVRAPETTPAATLLPRLSMGVVRAFTSLEGVTPRVQEPYVRRFPFGIVARPIVSDGFLGAEIRSSPLPFGLERSRFGTVSARTHRQAVSRLSWLSFSPPWICQGRRALSSARSVSIAGPELPTPVTVERTFSGPNPRNGFSPIHSIATPGVSAQGVSLSPRLTSLPGPFRRLNACRRGSVGAIG